MSRFVKSVLAMSVCAGLLVGCAGESSLAETIQARNSFTLNDAMGGSVDKAYVLRPYMSKDEAQALGFDPSDFFAVDDRPTDWETKTGIGVLHNDGSKPTVEWFNPQEINACPEGVQAGTQLDPDAEITVQKTPIESSDAESAVLHYSNVA